MTPEQEDAHWALMGKPHMRHWLEYLSTVNRTFASVAERNAAFDKLNRTLRDMGLYAHWAWDGATIDGVFYPDNVGDV